jgi:hypothetical protein
MCVFGGRGIKSQLASEAGTVLAGICKMLLSGILSSHVKDGAALDWHETNVSK